MADQSRSGVPPKNRQRDRLIRLAAAHPDWLLGFEDETWWSRLARPALHSWVDGPPLRPVEQMVASTDPDPQALACYGRRLPALDAVWLRFRDGRPVSAVTITFLAWCCQAAAARGKTALLVVWDNASWHGSKRVKTWLREHNREVKPSGSGLRIVVCPLPTKSPWLNPIEPLWVHTKRRIVAPDRLLPTRAVAQRVCDAVGCPDHEYIPIPEQVA